MSSFGLNFAFGKMGQKLLCCTNNLLVLPVCGVFMSLLGLVLLIIYIVARGITSSLHLVEAPIPTYLAALLTIAVGVLSIVLLRKRHMFLISISILLSVLDLIVCIVHAVTAALVSIPFLSGFSVCILRASSAECQCYILDEGNIININNTVIVPEDGTKHYTFQNVKSCGSIEEALKDFLYTLCIVYSFGAIGCLVTGALSTLLLCSSIRHSKDQDDEEVGISQESGRNPQTAQQEDETPGRSSAAQRALDRPANPRTPVRSASVQVTSSGVRPPRPAGRTPESRPVRRSASVTTTPTHAASSSAAATPSGSSNTRQASRFNSVAGTSGDGGTRQRPRLPLLVRGGYLQSHVNGPRIPIYMVQGSNESYIALTDLPKLQLPALNQVPAYVRDVAELPNYEPPPYSPTAETLSESPERVDAEEPNPSPPARHRLFDADASIEFQGSEIQPAPQTILPIEGVGQISRDSEEEQEPRETDVPEGSTETPVLGLQEMEPNQEVTVTAEIPTVHDAATDALPVVSSSENDTGVVNPVFEAEEADIVEDINRPPDILLEAIESARSSMNTTANTADASMHSTVQNETHHNEAPHTFMRDSATVRVPDANLDPGATTSKSAGTARIASDPRQESSLSQQKRGKQSDKASQSQRPRRTSNPSHDPTELQRRIGTLHNQQDIQDPTEAPMNDLSRNTVSRSREVKRTQSLISPRSQQDEYMIQDIPTVSSSRKRQPETYGRQQRKQYDTRTMDQTFSHDYRSKGIPYNNVTALVKLSSDRSRQRSHDRARPRQPGASNSENLNEIMNLVEAVHTGSPMTKRAVKKKKKRKSNHERKDNVAESRI